MNIAPLGKVNCRPVWLAKALLILFAVMTLAACNSSGGGDEPPPSPSTGIGPQGGTVSGAYGAQVIVPAGALTSNVDIAIARDSTNAPNFPPSETGAAGAAFEITPHGTTFALPATLRIPFDAAQAPADASPKIFKAELNGAFTEIPTTVDGDMLVADVTTLSWVIPGYASTRPRNVYAPTSGGISSYRITATTGALTGPTSTAPTGQAPSTVVAHPSGRFAYVTNGGSASANGVNPNSISVYKLDAISGAISGPTSTAPTSTAAGGSGSPPVSVIVHPSGRFVYVVNYGPSGGSTDVSVYTVNGATGALAGPTSTADSAGAPPTAIAIDPAGKFAYVTYVFRPTTPVGNTYYEQVKVFAINASSGVLTGPTSGLAAGSSPWSIAVEPTGKSAYVASRGSDELRTYGINATTGALTFLKSTSVESKPASIAVDSRGRFLYVGKQDPFSNVNVGAYSIDVASGALSPAGSVLVSGGAPGPIALVAEPQGDFVYALANSFTSGELTPLKVNASTGALTSAGAAVAGAVVPGGAGVGIPFSFAATGTSPIWVSNCTFNCSGGSGGGVGGGGGGGDTTAPSIAITGPTSAPNFTSSGATLTTLAGTASDAVGVTQVTWSNSLGGSGNASGTTSWSVGSIALQSGNNVITVTAHDAAGNTNTDSILVGFGSTHYLDVTRGVWNGSIRSAPPGIDYGEDANGLLTNLFSAPFVSGTLVLLCETPFHVPAQAYDVTWSGACSGTEACTHVLMDSDKDCHLELTPR